MTSVSVVIPCFNGADTIGRQLEALAAQDSPVPFEVIVADNASTDSSVARAAEYAPLVRVVDASTVPGINHARNVGITAANGRLVLFCDVDDLVHPGWIRAYVEAWQSGARIMGGPLRRVDADGGNPVWQRDFTSNLGFLPWPTGANCAVDRSVLDEVGPFDETLRGGGDETDLYWRAQLAGHRLAFVDGAGIDYTRRSDVGGVFRQQANFGRSHVKLFRRFGAAGMPRSQPWRLPRLLVVALLRWPRSRDRTQARHHVLALAGQLWGRASESSRSRTFYL